MAITQILNRVSFSLINTQNAYLQAHREKGEKSSHLFIIKQSKYSACFDKITISEFSHFKWHTFSIHAVRYSSYWLDSVLIILKALLFIL
ncbi:hypothetical protein XBKB1_1710007 [Xenorhabdus bovienii str. kraussei Becker Underwood]|uniref:Uncharacterized protein n=1 Tax=Xenorhabdus bovienii str. kraussei Becker Underwood TaxID=1398204 RepID=A0A077PQI7_XENBV|nr:hypothetical protein XBKB1_1710007 [Xenorhabdus bovienii str. kraussei Becker Underwood]